MKCQDNRRQMSLVLAAIIILKTTASSTELRNDLPSNHKDANAVPSASRLRMEARGENHGLELNAIETKPKSASLVFADKVKLDKPVISASTSKVAIVYSEHKPSETDKTMKLTKAPTEERNRRKSQDTITEKNVNPKKSSDQRNWRVVKVSPRDSYLDALDHSRTSKDSREGIVRVDTRPKISKLIRRDYQEGPVYRPSGDRYDVPKETSSTYDSSNHDSHSVESNNFARISYGAPTSEPFLPTPSDAYALPIQSSVNFNENNRNIYGAPHVSYSGQQQQTSYGTPSNSYGPPASLLQNSYGSPTNGYPSVGLPQQAYGSPSSSYGAPYAIQDYSQHLPYLPFIDFSWPIALKLNAFTVAKILLKLVIFKMIVKFIAVICFLLFIPKLEIIKKGDKDEINDDEDDSRRLLGSDSTLNILTALVTSSIEKYEKATGKLKKFDDECTSFGCRMRKFVIFDQSWNDYVRLFKNYVAEETNNDEDTGKLKNHVDS